MASLHEVRIDALVVSVLLHNLVLGPEALLLRTLHIAIGLTDALTLRPPPPLTRHTRLLWKRLEQAVCLLEHISAPTMIRSEGIACNQSGQDYRGACLQASLIWIVPYGTAFDPHYQFSCDRINSRDHVFMNLRLRLHVTARANSLFAHLSRTCRSGLPLQCMLMPLLDAKSRLLLGRSDVM